MNRLASPCPLPRPLNQTKLLSVLCNTTCYKTWFSKVFQFKQCLFVSLFMFSIVVFTWEMCNSVDIKVCKLENSPTHHFSTSPDDFYRQNWPFLLLDTSLNVQLCQHPLFLSLNFSLKILHIKRGRKKTPKWMF